MFFLALLAAGAVASPDCPAVGRQIIGSFGADAVLYDLRTNAPVGKVTMVKGVVSPPLVIEGCAGRYFVINQGGGQRVAVARTDVSYGEPMNGEKICAGNLNGSGANSNKLTGMHAGDSLYCRPNDKAKP